MTQQGGLARARGTNQRHHLAALHGEVYVAQGVFAVGEMLVQLVDVQCGSHGSLLGGVNSVFKSFVSRREAADSAVALQGEATTTRVILKRNYFQRTGSTCTLPCVLLSVMAPSCTVACSCMLRSASRASSCEASVGIRQTCSLSRRESLVSMPFHQISDAWLKQ